MATHIDARKPRSCKLYLLEFDNKLGKVLQIPCVWPPKVVFLFKFYQSSSCRNAYKVIISSAIYGLDKLKAVKAARPRLPTQRY